MSETKRSEEWKVTASHRALNTINPIRAIVDKIKMPKAPEDKPLIPLSLGDPSVFGNFPPPDNAIAAVVKAVTDKKFNGYAPSTGHVIAREAIAKKYSFPGAELTIADICITSGCSGALDIAMSAMIGKGDNVLLPQPGFALYNTICMNNYTEQRFYKLIPEKSWEIDLVQAATLIDENTKFMLINNPSNPCGAVYTKEHLMDIVAFAEKHHLAIISDEIYGNMIFPDQTFISLPTLTTEVPILVVSGLAKQYCCPGWRVGWVMIYDRKDRFSEVRKAITKLSQIIVGSNTIVQAAIPDMLFGTPEEYFTKHNTMLQEHCNVLMDGFEGITGLNPIRPQGAMYVMMGIDTAAFKDIEDDCDFCQKLLTEEFVFVLPGSSFGATNFVRLVFAAPVPILKDAVARIVNFVNTHKK